MADKIKKHKKAFDELPFAPLERVQTDGPVTEARISDLLKARPTGVSLCVRSVGGDENRGGYFFHITKLGPNRFQIFDFERTPVIEFDLAKLTRFVNHCSGLGFDQEMFDLCQSEINFRLDPQQSPEQEEQS